MFNNIQDPINNQWYSIDSNIGKSILRKYLKFNGGGNNQVQQIYDNNKLTNFLNENNNNYKIIGFFSDLCAHCIKTKPAWEKLNRLLENNSIDVKQATVDCTLDAFNGNDITKKNNINGFPTIRLYKKNKNEIVEFTSERTPSNLLAFVKENI